MARRRKQPGQYKQWKPGDTFIPYIRVSAVMGRGDDLISPEVQLDTIKKWAEREQVRLLPHVTDLDKSGREAMKRQIGSTIERVRNGEAQGIAVWKVSRWGRNLIDSMLNIHELQEANGAIGSATENLDDIETPMGKFSLTQMLAIAQLQSDQIGETWTNIHDFRRGKGLPHTGGERFGYLFNGDVKGTDRPELVYTPNPLTAPWLAKAYREFAAGRPATQIIKELDENGIRSVRGSRIVYRSLMATLDSGFGAGLIVDRRASGLDRAGNPNAWEFIPGAHEPVIPPEVWEAYLRRRAEKRAPREKNAGHRLSGLLYCASCGMKMKVRWAQRADRTKYRAFKCQLSGAKYVTTQVCEASASIAQSQLEERVMEWLTDQWQGEDAYATAVARQARAEEARGDISVIEKEIVRMGKRLSRATDMLLDEEDDDQIDALKAKVKEIRSEVKALERARDDLAVEVTVADIPATDAFGALVAAWSKPGHDSLMNEALRQVIARIEVSPGARVNHDRVRIIGTWEADTAA
jgi:site-specific DNA recombinase